MNFTANERRKINTAKRAAELQELRETRDGFAHQVGMLITERNELREDNDQLARLCAERHAEIAKLHARITTLQGEPADALHSLRAQRDAYRQGFEARSQALNERANAQCRAENERDALRACLVRCFGHLDDFTNTLENAGANIAATKAEASHLLSTIAAPEITSIRAVVSGALDAIPVRPVSRVNIDDAGRAK